MTEVDGRGKHVRSLSCMILVKKGQAAKSKEEVTYGPGIL